MRDHVTEERISAYVDGELEGDELALVENLLAESAEYRQLASELQELRASMQSFPRFNLPADFTSKIVSQIEATEATPSPEPVHANRGGSKARAWRSVLYAAASLAAMVTLAIMLRPSKLPGPGPIGGDGPELNPVTFPVYLQQEPDQYVMVYDVTVTAAGQKSDVVAKLLRKHGFGIDRGVKLDAGLEDDLIAMRSPAVWPPQENVEPFKDPAAKAVNERIEMVYVAGMLLNLGDFGQELRQIGMAQEELLPVQFDMVFEPDQLGAMRRLHGSVREHFANNWNGTYSDSGQAFRLSFRIELTSLSVPGTAAFPLPVIRPNAGLSSEIDREASSFAQNERSNVDIESLSVPIAPRGVKASPNGEIEVVDTRPPLEDELQTSHVLLILRYENAN